MFESLLRKLVWLMEGDALVKMDKSVFEHIGCNLADIYLKKGEPDLAKMVLKKVSENDEARAEAAKLWRLHHWFPLHAAARFQREHPRSVDEWQLYVRFAQAIGFELAEKDQSGQTSSDLLKGSEKEEWSKLFTISAAPVVDPWRN